jgi:N-acetylglucosaminyldiphosphoundecaprenol N-acetyl-beta-D-mannosaminyltransferase
MVKVLGISLYDKNISAAISHFINLIKTGMKKENRCISATGAHGIVYAQKNLSFKELLNNFYQNLPDGMPGVWIGKLKGAKQMKRCYGPDFFKDLMVASADQPVKHFLCGGKDGVADELKRQCGIKFNNYNIVGTFCPPFRKMSEEELIELGQQISASDADVVWIGLSTPKQEQFAWQLRKYARVHFIITVGAAFDFHTDRLKRTPSWIQKIGMEWCYRLLSEPKRLYKRYLEIVPLFIYYNFKEFIDTQLIKKLKSNN